MHIYYFKQLNLFYSSFPHTTLISWFSYFKIEHINLQSCHSSDFCLLPKQAHFYSSFLFIAKSYHHSQFTRLHALWNCVSAVSNQGPSSLLIIGGAETQLWAFELPVIGRDFTARDKSRMCFHIAYECLGISIVVSASNCYSILLSNSLTKLN